MCFSSFVLLNISGIDFRKRMEMIFYCLIILMYRFPFHRTVPQTVCTNRTSTGLQHTISRGHSHFVVTDRVVRSAATTFRSLVSLMLLAVEGWKLAAMEYNEASVGSGNTLRAPFRVQPYSCCNIITGQVENCGHMAVFLDWTFVHFNQRHRKQLWHWNNSTWLHVYFTL
jgi:hypothetical protein